MPRRGSIAHAALACALCALLVQAARFTRDAALGSAVAIGAGVFALKLGGPLSLAVGLFLSLFPAWLSSPAHLAGTATAALAAPAIVKASERFGRAGRATVLLASGVASLHLTRVLLRAIYGVDPIETALRIALPVAGVFSPAPSVHDAAGTTLAVVAFYAWYTFIVAAACSMMSFASERAHRLLRTRG